MDTAAISNIAANASNTRYNRELLKKLKLLQLDANEEQIKEVFVEMGATMKLHDQNKSSTRKQRKEVNNPNAGYNTQLRIPPGPLTPQQKIEIINQTNNISRNREQWAKIKEPEHDEVERFAESFRMSMPMKENGNILARQFGSLSYDLQMKLLGDPCFLNADAVRIQVYGVFGDVPSVPLSFHQDAITADIVQRALYSRSVVVSEAAASTSSTGLDLDDEDDEEL